MDKLKELKELMKDLSPGEVEELKAFLSNSAEDTPTEEEAMPVAEEPAQETPSEEVADAPVEDAPAEETSEEETEEPSEESAPEESTPAEEPSEETETGEEETAEEPVEETPAEEEKVEEQEEVATLPEEDDIPAMQRGIAESMEEPTEPAPNITAEDGEEIPVDYQQIIDGLNAKLAATEAENKMLKAKYEGAFGYSAKASVPTKVNRLFDDCSDIHIHK